MNRREFLMSAGAVAVVGCTTVKGGSGCADKPQRNVKSSAAADPYPPPKELGTRFNPTAVNIARTMEKLEKSTAEKPATVRILFYGQSVVAQDWTDRLVAMMRRRYPTANIIAEKRAIGGFTSERLWRTAYTDVYPYYPDLLFFHVWGDVSFYEELVRRTREVTTADIVLWSSHLRSYEDKHAYLARPSHDERLNGMAAVAEKYKCMWIDLNRKWCDVVLAHGKEPQWLLADTVHLNSEPGNPAFDYYAGFIGEDLSFAETDAPSPASGTIEEIPLDDPRVNRHENDGDWSVELDFDGNRVEAIWGGTGWSVGHVTLDGRELKDVPGICYSTRASPVCTWRPFILYPGVGSNAVAEDWTLTFLEGTDPYGKPIHFRVDGSVTGFDGEGWSTNRFVSKSGRVILEVGDFNTEIYDYFCRRAMPSYKDERLIDYFKSHLAKPGVKIYWKTLLAGASDPVSGGAGESTVLAQGFENGPHRLSIKYPLGVEPGISHGVVRGLKGFRVYRPAKTAYEPVSHEGDGSAVWKDIFKVDASRK